MNGDRLRRAYRALAIWYAAAWLLPVVVVVVLNASTASDDPGFTTTLDGRRQECTGHFGCPTGPVHLSSVIVTTGVFLALSLVVSAPLCAALVRKWEMPGTAAFIAALTGWSMLCVGGLVYVNS